ncbi:uncharacterized protein MELLADRAFT_93598 [Melampsora larici-populina 98AG31]|uniref:Uncharacterized protein n=1 Tax=Melampsora larici-populina (strain 98AG31 / pathotype 3-4-7) TaxID=747676 RepID=F4RB06_MELLP|nr:uncharacterized protein MELLADRAFT_93598 [Melampsora larici-populina 98AG31]EGG10684.1 hypothetical protein MELLADRAFT_93598 [Melampsora larici-populina 98AG31]
MCWDLEASPIPPSLSEHKQKNLLENFPEGQPIPSTTSMPVISVTYFEKTGVHLSPHRFKDVELVLQLWGINRFLFKWEANLEDCVNVLAKGGFWNSFHNAIKNCYYNFSVHKHILKLNIIMPVLLAQFKCLSLMCWEEIGNIKILDHHYILANKKQVLCFVSFWLPFKLLKNTKAQVCKEYRQYLVKCGAARGLVYIFQPQNYAIMGKIAELKSITSISDVSKVHYFIPSWWSEEIICFFKAIEAHVHFYAQSCNVDPHKIQARCVYITRSSKQYNFIPCHLPANLYTKELKNSLPIGDLWALKMRLLILESILPSDTTELVDHSLDRIADEHYSSDNKICNIDTNVISETPSPNTNLGELGACVNTQISTSRFYLENSVTTFSNYQTKLNGIVPLRLEELNKAKADIANLNRKFKAMEAKLGKTETEKLNIDAAQTVIDN